MSKQTFTDEPPIMDPDKPVRCLWFVMYRIVDGFMAWGGRVVDDIRSEGPFEDRDAAVKGAEKLGTSGYHNCHVLAIVPAIFQDGDYIEDYKPYEKKPMEVTSIIDAMDGVYANLARDMERAGRDQIGQIINNIDIRAVRVPLPNHMRYFYNAPEPPAPPVVVRPGDGIAKALEAKVEGIRRSARVQDRLPARDTTYRGLRSQKGSPTVVKSNSWTGRGKR